MSESKYILSRPSDLNQTINDFIHSNLNVQPVKKQQRSENFPSNKDCFTCVCMVKYKQKLDYMSWSINKTLLTLVYAYFIESSGNSNNHSQVRISSRW
jgi:hypothetical protein